MATGLALMIRQSRRRTDRAAVVDALTVTAGFPQRLQRVERGP
ncbi:hypothetical protein [Paractinoplanes abujensis]|uniref:Uncharacterized protein n=1 Tax=Paractinoplanes abujensis TaxID=882441 RepID=A0A7W7CSC7_9ACTN|nr:hypothetical protein [Actinoplanes abujensis]MBB4693797.1 hypothetical protein [Actinoplanes abujensis]